MNINKSKLSRITALSILCIIIPASAFADFSLINSNFRDLVGYIIDTIRILIPIMYALAFVIFFWGLSIFILKDSKNEKTRADGKKKMLWGIIALFILASFRMIVALISNDLGISTGFDFPTLKKGVMGDVKTGLIPPGQIPPQ